MKKKLLALILVLVLSMCAFSGALASSRYTANYNKAVSIVNNANYKIRLLVLTAQLTPFYDVPQLLVATQAVAANAKARVAALGFKVGCEYAYYWVDGCYVAIDPLYVVNPLPGDKTEDEKD